MSSPEAAVSFRELFAYTDYLAKRWLKYFAQNPAALEVDVGGKTGTVRDPVHHIFLVEQVLAGRVWKNPRQEELTNPSLDDLARLHREAHKQLVDFSATAGHDSLRQTQPLLCGSQVSNRKMLTQAALHTLRQSAGFHPDRHHGIIWHNSGEPSSPK